MGRDVSFLVFDLEKCFFSDVENQESSHPSEE